MLGMPGFDHEYNAFDNRARIYQVFAWWPRRCWITGHWMWLTQVTAGIAVWTGPGTPIVEKRYYNSAEYLMYQLKQ